VPFSCLPLLSVAEPKLIFSNNECIRGTAAERAVPRVMTSVDEDAEIGAAIGVATSAGELLALRDDLSEKELELLEMQQSFAALVAKRDEVKAQLKTASRFKEDSANILQSAVKFKEEAQITAKNATQRADKLQADLKATREAAASAKTRATHYKEKCEAEVERAAAAESAAAALRTELETAKKSASAKVAELKRKLDSQSAEVITKKDHELRLRESAEAEARLSAELAKFKESGRDVETNLRDELSRTRDELAAALAEGKASREKMKSKATMGDTSGQLLATVQRMAREQIEATREEVSRAYEVAKSREKEAQDARQKVESLQQSHAVLKATMDQLCERVDDTKRHAETRTEAATRHKATSRDLRKQLAEVHATLADAQAELRSSRRGETRDTRHSGVLVSSNLIGAAEEATSVLSAALRQCFESGSNSHLVNQWMDAGGRKDDKGASVLLAVAHRAAGALVTATSRASDAEYAAEHAMHSLEDTQLELNAVQAERDAARAAASASDERANRSNEELRDALNRLRDSDKKTQKLDEVIRRLASRS